jgi:serine protease
MSSPTPGSTLSGPTVTFSWAAGVGASAYWLDVGTVQGQGTIFAQNVGLVTSQMVNGISTAGGTIYVRLWTQLSGNWQYHDYMYTAASSGITTPAPDSVLPSPSATFNWTAVAGADQYWLDVGSAVAIGDYYGGPTTGTSASVNNLPCDARTVYVQLWAHISGNWQTPVRYTYTATGGCAALTSPASNAALSGTSATFTWNAIGGADQYWLDLGNSIGVGDIFAGSTTSTSVAVNSIPCDGRFLYAQLWTHSNGAWHSPGRYDFTAWGACGRLTVPSPGATLSGSTVTFNWNAGMGVTAYWLDVGTVLGQGNIFGANLGTVLSRTVSGIPTDGSMIYVQLWSQIGGVWYLNRYSYTAF